MFLWWGQLLDYLIILSLEVYLIINNEYLVVSFEKGDKKKLKLIGKDGQEKNT